MKKNIIIKINATPTKTILIRYHPIYFKPPPGIDFNNYTGNYGKPNQSVFFPTPADPKKRIGMQLFSYAQSHKTHL